MLQIPTIDTSLMIYILLALLLTLAIWIFILEKRIRKIMGGKDAKSLEETILQIHKEVDDLHTFRKDSIEYLKNIEARLKRSVQAVETIRFNPFKGTGDGGNQSFSTAFLNEKGDGALITSLYVRDHVSVYSKPVKKFASEFETTEEEKNAIRNAQESLAYESKVKK